MNYMVPPINSKGVFKFAAPYDTLLKPNMEYKVAAVRDLIELKNSEEKPFDTIYVAVGLTEVDFKEDLDAGVPIVSLVTEGQEYVYVPADRIISTPNVTGIKYQSKILAVSLGSLPLATNLDTAKSIVVDTIYDTLGIESDVQVVDSSAVILKDKGEHTTFMNLLDNRKTVRKSFRTKYQELEVINQAQSERILALEKYIKEKL